MNLSPIFAIGTGRCGTHLLEALLNESKYISSHHIQDLNLDSFYRYTRWYNLPVDQSPLLKQRELWIKEAHIKDKIYFESNPYLSFHVDDFHSEFKAKFIFIYRNPESVIRSHLIKGWYKDIATDNVETYPGLVYGVPINHSLGRIQPLAKEERREWFSLSQAGKIAWMWSEVNGSIDRQLQAIPADKKFYLRIEELNFEKLLELEEFVGVSLGLNERKFNKIIEAKPGKGKTLLNRQWSANEVRDINKFCSSISLHLGYKNLFIT